LAGINTPSSHPPQVLRWFSEWHDGDLTICRIKNGFATTEVAADGYRDLKLYVIFTNRAGLSIIGEIQIHDERLHDLKLVHVRPAAAYSIPALALFLVNFLNPNSK
jgi:hypothetical protein